MVPILSGTQRVNSPPNHLHHCVHFLSLLHLDSFHSARFYASKTSDIWNLTSFWWWGHSYHYGDDIMGKMASQITSLTIVYSAVYSGADQRKHQSSSSLAFVRRIHRGPVNSPHKWPVTRKMFSIWWRHHATSQNTKKCGSCLWYLATWKA